MSRTNADRVLDHIRGAIAAGGESAPTDAQLLQAFAGRGEETAFAGLVQRHGRLVWGVCRRVLRDSHDAEDAFQATFLVLARNASSIRKQQSVGSWLYGVAARLSHQLRKRLDRRRAHEGPAEQIAAATDRPAAQPGPSEEVSLREALAILDEEVGRLPEKFRSALVLCYLQGKTNEEAARELGCPAGTLKSRLLRARELLHERLTARGVTLPAGAAAVLLATADTGAAVPEALTRAAVSTGKRGPVSAEATRLAARMVRSLALRRLQGAAAVLLMLSVLGVGAGLIVHQQIGPAPREQPGTPRRPQAGPKVKVDSEGVELPPGAVARLGSARWRHGSRLSKLVFAAGGKEIVTAGPDGVAQVLDATSGRVLRRLGSASPLQGTPFPRVRPLALSADGSTAALADDSGTVGVWAVKTGKEQWRVQFKGENELWDLDLSRDGKTLLTSALGSKVILWDVGTGKRLRALETQPGGWEKDGKDISTVQRLVFSADGKWIAAPFFDGPGKGGTATAGLCIWDAHTGKEVRRFSESEDGLDRLSPANVPPMMAFAALAPDGRTVARVALDGSVHLNDRANGKELHRLGAGGGPPVAGIVFSPDGKRLAVVLRNRTARLYDPATGKLLRTLGEAVAMLDAGGLGLPLDFDIGDYYLGPGAAFSPDGKTLALVAGKNTLRLWDVNSGKPRGGGAGVSGSVEEVAVTANGKEVLTKTTDGSLRRWEASTGKELRRLRLPRASLWWVRQNWLDSFDGLGRAPEGTGVTLSPAGGLLAVLGENAVGLWDASAKRVREVELPPPAGRGFGAAMRAPYQARVSADEKVLATAESPRVVRLWDPATGKELRQLTEARRTPGGGNVNVHGLGLEVSPDGGAVVTGVFKGLVVPGEVGAQTILRVWDTKTGKTKRWQMPGFVATATFTADGRSLATATANRITLWDTATGKERWRCETAASRLACSPSGRVLAAARGREVLLLGLRTGKEFGRLRGHDAAVRALAFSRDGKILVSGSADGTALVWGGARLLPSAARRAGSVSDRSSHPSGG